MTNDNKTELYLKLYMVAIQNAAIGSLPVELYFNTGAIRNGVKPADLLKAYNSGRFSYNVMLVDIKE